MVRIGPGAAHAVEAVFLVQSQKGRRRAAHAHLRHRRLQGVQHPRHARRPRFGRTDLNRLIGQVGHVVRGVVGPVGAHVISSAAPDPLGRVESSLADFALQVQTSAAAVQLGLPGTARTAPHARMRRTAHAVASAVREQRCGGTLPCMTDTRASLVSAAFVKLTEAFTGDYDALAVLHTLVEQSVGLLDAAAAGLLLADAEGQLHLVASSSRQSELLELLQLNAGIGPCLDAYTSGLVVTVRDLRSDTRYREFGAEALAQGFISVHAVPMRAGGTTIGGLNLFRNEPGLLTEEDAAIARALADVATVSILQERTVRQSTVTNEQLQRALTSRILIEQAKGVIAQDNTITMAEAFQRLRAHARAHNVTVQTSAEGVVNRLLRL